MGNRNDKIGSIPRRHREKYPNLEHMLPMELVMMLHETKTYTPEDAEFIKAINEELKIKSEGKG